MKKAFILIGCGMLILWCITAALLYCGMFQDNPSDFGYGLFGLLCGAEGLASGMSLLLYWMSKRNRWVTAVYILSAVLKTKPPKSIALQGRDKRGTTLIRHESVPMPSFALTRLTASPT